MNIDTEQLVKEILSRVSHWDYIKTSELPDIDLYMDQITSFMDTRLASTKRYPEDKILTKTMINNYAKNHLLPSPQKKKYSKNHMLLLIFIYYFKNIMSIHDIQTLINPIVEKHFDDSDGLSLDDIYKEVMTLERSQVQVMEKDLLQKLSESKKTFTDAPEDEQEFLQMFSMICSLSYDVYIKKQLIERLIDELQVKTPSSKKDK